jgi:hypothetical protein
MAIDGSVTLGVADGAYPALGADGLTGTASNASVSLTGASLFPSASASGLAGTIGDGDSRPGDPDNIPQDLTPLTLDGVLAGEHLFSGVATLPVYRLDDASLEPPPLLPTYDLSADGVSGTLGVGTATPPPWALAAALLAGGAGAGAAQLPLPAVAGDTGPGADITLAPFTLGTALLAGTVAGASVLLDAPQLAASALQHGLGAGAAVLDLPTLVATTGAASARYDGAAQLEHALLAASGLAGASASGAAQLAAWLAAGVALASNSGAGSIHLAPPAVDGAQAARAQAALYRMLAINTRTNAVTEYSNMAFNSFATFNGVVLGASADGIMALQGDTDSGAPIAASMTSGQLDFDSAQHKRVSAGYVGYRADGVLTLALAVDGVPATSNTLAPRAAGLHPSRTPFGRGARGRYWQWQLANSGGAGFTLDALAFDVDVLARRV